MTFSQPRTRDDIKRDLWNNLPAGLFSADDIAFMSDALANSNVIKLASPQLDKTLEVLTSMLEKHARLIGIFQRVGDRMKDDPTGYARAQDNIARLIAERDAISFAIKAVREW